MVCLWTVFNCFQHQILVINPIVANNLANKERFSQGQHVLSVKNRTVPNIIIRMLI